MFKPSELRNLVQKFKIISFETLLHYSNFLNLILMHNITYILIYCEVFYPEGNTLRILASHLK